MMSHRERESRGTRLPEIPERSGLRELWIRLTFGVVCGALILLLLGWWQLWAGMRFEFETEVKGSVVAKTKHQVRLRLTASEAWKLRLEIGDPVILHIRGGEGERWSGIVAEVSDAATESASRLEVTVVAERPADVPTADIASPMTGQVVQSVGGLELLHRHLQSR